VRVTIDIPETDREFLTQLVQDRGYTWVEEEEQLLDIPEWQKEETLRRRATTKPEDYKPWSEVKKRWGL